MASTASFFNHHDHDHQEDEEGLTCSVCLDLFSEPVTLPCGHTYCRDCVQKTWTTSDEATAVDVDSCCVCPDCRRIFSPKPELSRNVVIADLAARLSEMRVARQAAAEMTSGRGGGDATEEPCDTCACPEGRVTLRLCSRCESHQEPHGRLPHLPRLNHQPLVALRAREARGRGDEEEGEEGEGRRGASHVAEERARQSDELLRCKRALRDRQRSINLFLHELHRTTLALEESCVATESRLGAKFDSLMELLAEERLSALATPRAELRAKEAELHGEAARLRAELGLLQEALGVVRQLEETESHVAFIRGFMRDGERLVALSQSPLEPPVRPGLDFVESSRSEAYVDRMLAFLSGPSGPNGPGEECGEPEEEEGRRWRRFRTGSRSGSREGVEAPQLPQLRAALGSLFRRRSSGSGSKEVTSRRTYIKNYGCTPTLNPDTAHPRLLISDDLRTATWSQEGQPLHNGGVDGREQPERFHDTWYPQALCSESFASGRHYWEVDVTAAGRWLVGVAYGSLPLQDRSTLGMNSSSWCLQGEPGALVAWHAGAETAVESRGGHGRRPGDRRGVQRRGADAVGTVGVYVDWEAGRLSFFGGDGDSLRLLHSFRAAFSRPLHPAVGVFWSGSVYHAGAVGSVSIVKVVDKR